MLRLWDGVVGAQELCIYARNCLLRYVCYCCYLL